MQRVYWKPPESAMNKIFFKKKIIMEPVISRYGSHDRLPECQEALLGKVNLFIMRYITYFPNTLEQDGIKSYFTAIDFKTKDGWILVSTL